MLKTISVKPKDILPDGVDYTIINGTTVRKGTIAAFLANVDVLENQNAPLEQRENALELMKALAPTVIATGLHKHVIFKNLQVEKILAEAACALND